MKWAMAARNQQKLATVRQELCKLHPSAQVLCSGVLVPSADKLTVIMCTLVLKVHFPSLSPFWPYLAHSSCQEAAQADCCNLTAPQRPLWQSMHGTGMTLSHMQEIPLLTGDLSDRQSLKAIAAQTQVVLNTAGPYTKLGTPVVEACISEKTHHCDLTGACPGLSCSLSSISAHAYSKHLRILWGSATLQLADPPAVLLAQASTHAGEYTWVKQIQRQYQDEAANNEVKIVNCCGFDSIPSDLGAQMLVNHIKKKFGRCMQPPHRPPHANDQPPANSSWLCDAVHMSYSDIMQYQADT